MHISGSGTRDSPIAIDDDSEDENLPTYNYRDYSFTLPSDLLLSPRPGTFLSTISRPRLTTVPVQNIQQVKQESGSQKPHNRKRKRTATPAQSLPAALPAHNYQQNLEYSVPLQQKQKQAISTANAVPSQSQKESKKQKKLRARLERERAATQAKVKAKGKSKVPTPSSMNNQHSQNQTRHTPLQDENAPPSKRVKHSKTMTLQPHMDHLSLTSGPVSSSLTERPPVTSASTSYAPQPQPQPQPRRACHLPHNTPVPALAIPPSAIPPSAPQYLGDHPHPLPPRPPVPQVPFDSLMDPSLMLTNMQVQTQYDMEFNPSLPWLYMPMGACPTPMPMASMSMTPMSIPTPTIDQSAIHSNPAPPKATSKMKPKANQKPEAIRLPQHQLNHEKPFTIRVFSRGTEAWVQSMSYLPIGKPDLQFKHGIFPIIPSIMLPPGSSKSASGSTACQNSFVPNILSTLVLENVPKTSCNVSWVKKWCVGASGARPKRVLVAPRRALIEFQEPGDAVKAWASRRLGIDELGNRASMGESGDVLSMPVYWYRPDLEQERGLLELWRHSKKLLPEIVGVAVVKDEGVVLRAIEEALGAVRGKLMLREREEGEVEENEDGGSIVEIMGVDINSVQQNWLAPDVKGEFRKLAERMGFWKKYEDAKKSGMNDDYLLVWEQQETARIDRVRSIAYARQKKGSVPQGRKRKLEEEDEEGELKEDDSKRKRAWKTAEEDVVIKQPSAPAATVPASAVAPVVLHVSRPISHAPTSGLTLRPAAMKEVKPVAPVISRNVVGPTSGFAVPPSLPPKPKELPSSSSNIGVSGSTLTSAFGGPVPMPSVPSAFTFSSMTSPTTKQPRGFGLSLVMPPPVPSTSQNRPTSSSTSVPATPLSAPVLPTHTNGKKQPQVNSTAESTSVSTSLVPPAPRLSTIPAAVQHKQREDVVMKDTRESSVGVSVTEEPSLRSATLFIAVKEKEEDVRIARTTEPAQVVENPPVLQEHTPRDTGIDDVGEPSSGEVRVVDHSNTKVAPSPWRHGEESLVNGLRTVGRALLSQDSPSSPSLAALNASSRGPASIVSANPESPIEPKSALPKPLPVSEPGVLEEVPLPNTNDQKDTTSDDMDISPVAEKAAALPLPTSIIQTVAPPSRISKQETHPQPQQEAMTIAVPPIVSPSTPILSTVPVKSPVQAQTISMSSKALVEITKMLAKSKEEKQVFLDREFKATKALMERLMATTCKKQKRGITGLWKEKIRVIDEVTKSIRNDGKVWYSHETSTWIRLRWPDTPEGAGLVEISDEEE